MHPWITMLGLSACAVQGPVDASRDTAPFGSVTWHQDIAPLVEGHCNGCHSGEHIASHLPWTDPEVAANAANWIASVTSERTMPPFFAASSPTCEPPLPYAQDARLTEDELGLIARWASEGAPLGDPSTAAPLPETEVFALEEWSVEYQPSSPYSLEWVDSPNGPIQDIRRCWSFDLSLTENAYIDTLEVLPGNLQVVHHVRIDLSDGPPKEEQDADGSFACEATQFGQRATAWVPGTKPYQTPPGSGLELAAGTHIIMNIHYHLTEDTPHEDLTRLRVRFMPSPPERIVRNIKVGNDHVRHADGTGLQPGPHDTKGPEFLIPAGVTSHVETMMLRVPDDSPPMNIWMVGHHMHFVGVEAKLTLQRNPDTPHDSDSTCLLHVSPWNYDWQLFYTYEDPTQTYVPLLPGDVLALSCTYDNTWTNSKWAQALALEGVSELPDVGLSDGSLAEMCAALVGVVMDPQ